MWKIKLDDDLWLADSAVTTAEDKARLFPDMSSVQEQLKEVRRFTPYPDAMVIYEGDSTPKTANITEKSNR